MNDQGLRAIAKYSFRINATTKPPSDPYSLDGFAWVGPGLGEKPAREGIIDVV